MPRAAQYKPNVYSPRAALFTPRREALRPFSDIEPEQQAVSLQCRHCNLAPVRGSQAGCPAALRSLEAVTKRAKCSQGQSGRQRLLTSNLASKSRVASSLSRRARAFSKNRTAHPRIREFWCSGSNSRGSRVRSRPSDSATEQLGVEGADVAHGVAQREAEEDVPHLFGERRSRSAARACRCCGLSPRADRFEGGGRSQCEMSILLEGHEAWSSSPAGAGAVAK